MKKNVSESKVYKYATILLAGFFFLSMLSVIGMVLAQDADEYVDKYRKEAIESHRKFGEKEERRVMSRFLRSLGQIPQNRLRQEFMKITKSIGMPERSRVHELRHLFITSMAETEINPMLAGQVAGHSTQEMSDYYTHTRSQAQRRSIEKMIKNKSKVSLFIQERFANQDV